MTDRRWAVACVISGAEEKIETKLRRIGVASYWPRYKRRIITRRRVAEVVKNVYPGYMFVDASTISNAEGIKRIYDLLYFIRTEAGNLSLMPSAAIDRLRDLEIKNILMPSSIDRAADKFVLGDQVRVGDGICSGYTGTVIAESRGKVMLAGGDFAFGTEISIEKVELAR